MLVLLFIISIVVYFFWQQIKELQIKIKRLEVKYEAMRTNYHKEIEKRRIYNNLNDRLRKERDEYKQQFDYTNMKLQRILRIIRNKK